MVSVDGVKIGQTKNCVRKILGEPHKRESDDDLDCWKYQGLYGIPVRPLLSGFYSDNDRYLRVLFREGLCVSVWGGSLYFKDKMIAQAGTTLYLCEALLGEPHKRNGGSLLEFAEWDLASHRLQIAKKGMVLYVEVEDLIWRSSFRMNLR